MLGSAAAIFCLLLIVCLGPLPYGSVLVRERTWLQICAFLALALAAASRWRPLATGSLLPPAMVAAIGSWGVVQSLPLPISLTRNLAPWIAERWQEWAAMAGNGLETAPLSLAPAVSRTIGFHWLAVAAAMAAASLVGNERRTRRLIFGGFLSIALFEVIFGAEKWLARNEMMWGLEVAGDPGRLRGTFINADHLAFYLILAIAVALAWLWWSSRDLWTTGRLENNLLLTVAPGLLFLTLFAGVAFTGSRAGLVAMVLAILVQALLLALHYRRWQVGLAAAGAVVLGAGGLVLFGLRQGLDRWLSTSAYELTWNSRFTVYRASWDLWQASPWTGTGLGTFRQAFPSVQPADLERIWIHAHSDVLEILVTAGAVALPLLGIGLLALYRHLFTVFQHGRRSEDRAVGLAALVAVTGALLHSLVDFSLTLPANAFTLAIVCGLASAAPTGRRQKIRR